MNIVVEIDVKEAIRRGKPSTPNGTVELAESVVAEWSQGEREALSELIRVDRQSNHVFFTRSIPEKSVDGIREVVVRNVEAIRIEAAKKAEIAAEAKKVMDVLDVKRFAELYEKNNGHLYGSLVDYVGVNGEPCHALEPILKADPRWPEIIKPYEIRKAEYEAKRTADRESEKEAERKAKEAELSERLAWIEANGSDRLKRLVFEEIECTAVYRDERLALERPNWVWYDDPTPGKQKEPRNPPVEAFGVLDEARKVDPEAKLSYYVIDPSTDECGEEVGDGWKGYVAVAEFLGRDIVFGLPAEVLA